MKTNKLLAIFLTASMILGLTACSLTNTSDVGLDIVIITSPNTVDDGTFNEANYDGVLNFLQARGNIDSITAIHEETGEADQAVALVAEVVDDYDVLLCVSYLFESITSIAEENPDKVFLLIDSFPVDHNGNTVELSNVYAMTFAEQESGFFAGVAAALETRTGKVAVVNGIAYPSNVNYQFGFESGVNYAVANLGADAQCVELVDYAGIDVTGVNVGGNYIHSFTDEETAEFIGKALIAENVDIIFVAAGRAGNGVFTAVKKSEATDWVIGCDVDQYENGMSENENIVLTSVLKNMAINVERQLYHIVEGTFQGENVVLYAETDSTGYVSTEGHHQLSEETLAILEELYPLVKSRTIQPAANFSGTAPTNFPGL